MKNVFHVPDVLQHHARCTTPGKRPNGEVNACNGFRNSLRHVWGQFCRHSGTSDRGLGEGDSLSCRLSTHCWCRSACPVWFHSTSYA